MQRAADGRGPGPGLAAGPNGPHPEAERPHARTFMVAGLGELNPSTHLRVDGIHQSGSELRTAVGANLTRDAVTAVHVLHKDLSQFQRGRFFLHLDSFDPS